MTLRGKQTTAVALLCACTGALLLVLIRPDPVPSATAGPPRPPSGQSLSGEAPAVSAASSPDSTPAGAFLGTKPRPRAGPAVELPPPPSGDFEQTLTAAQLDAIVEARYGALLGSLSLPPGELARLRARLAERQQALIEAANAAIIVGLNPVRDAATIRAAITAAGDEADELIRREFGEAVFVRYIESDRTLRERNAVADLARVLAPTREPLRPEQENRVVEILRESAEPPSPGDIGQALFGGINTRSLVSEKALLAAAAVLSPSQLEALRQLQRQAPAAVSP